ncbi:MAG TPA: type II secretion system F family protein [Gemmatimonadales bacterium]|nr:type II secretion system F family protein [Gemmatimonadales bacterium]
MPVFEYTAKSAATGQILKGSLDASSRDELLGHLRKNRLVLVSMREAPREFKIAMPGAGVKTRDVVIFTRQFATMINSGLPLVQSLNILAQQTENVKLKEITRSVVFDVEAGNTLADALSKHPAAFSQLYVNMVAAGEAGGILDTILLRLATFMEKNDALVRKVKSAMIYPGVILTVAAGAIAILLIFVIPVFDEMFRDAGVELPLPTRVVIWLSNFLQEFWWAVLLGVGLVAYAIKKYYDTQGGKRRVDAIMLGMPVLGDVLRKSAVARFTRTLGTLISSGVSILDGLEITAKTAGNTVIQDAIMESRSSIAGGDTIAAPLEKSGVFPPMVISMIAVGEQTGGLDEMLSKIADFYDDEVDVAVAGLLALLEPMMILFLGVIVGGMIVAMYLPIFGMMETIQ